MAKELDIKDKKIIYHLFTDGRMSDSELSKKVRLSKKGIAYRIDRLQKNWIIVGFKSVVDLTAVKLHTAMVLFKFNEDIVEKQEITEFFKQHPFANWAAILSGQWDLLCEFVIHDMHQFASIISEVTEKFGKTLCNYKTFTSDQIIRVEHLVKDFYKDLDVEEFTVKPRTTNKYDLDEVDKKLLHQLCEDSSLSYLELSKKLNLTLDVVRYRIKQLQQKEIIVKFAPVIALGNLGYTQFLNTVTFKNVSKEDIDKIKTMIAQSPDITYAFFDVLEYSLVFTSAFKDSNSIDHLHRMLRKQFADIIDSQDYHIIKEHVHFNLFPKGLLE